MNVASFEDVLLDPGTELRARLSALSFVGVSLSYRQIVWGTLPAVIKARCLLSANTLELLLQFLLTESPHMPESR